MELLNSHSKHIFDTGQIDKLIASARKQIEQMTRPALVAPPKKAHRLTTAEITALVAGYQAGETTYALATKFNASRDTIRKHLTANKVKMRRRGLSPSQVTKAVDLYNEAWSSNAIATQFDVSPTTVLRRLRELGVVMS